MALAIDLIAGIDPLGLVPPNEIERLQLVVETLLGPQPVVEDLEGQVTGLAFDMAYEVGRGVLGELIATTEGAELDALQRKRKCHRLSLL